MSRIVPTGKTFPLAADDLPQAVKILVAGGFGTGKTTLVSTISEITPFHTEETLTRASIGIDDTSGIELKATTTVAMDFGRISIRDRLDLFLFGTPGQDRFWFMWDELAAGALCAVVLVDTRRLTVSFPSIDYFERRGLPFVVAVNSFAGSRTYPVETVRAALDLNDDVPVLICDARQRKSVKELLISALQHALTLEERASSTARAALS
ncbi:GTP-binding protein [Streptomyces kaempferi]|uniref:ATP/GTP-binding protein n=1 Tax=Streptomyces kaempferi TaxID=333725 RepID=A0ABW3XV85_9ACTN